MLSNLCDKIQEVGNLINSRIRKIFSLSCLVKKASDTEVEFLPKKQLMVKLEEYDNLINAMGALFYVSKQMVNKVPCAFEAWKEFAFEKRASKIHDMLSSGNLSITSPLAGSALGKLSPDLIKDLPAL